MAVLSAWFREEKARERESAIAQEESVEEAEASRLQRERDMLHWPPLVRRVSGASEVVQQPEMDPADFPYRVPEEEGEHPNSGLPNKWATCGTCLRLLLFGPQRLSHLAKQRQVFP